MAYLDSIMPGSRVQQVSAMGAAVKEYNDRDARIAELEKELAEIREQKKSLDVEADMGRYKFQYDADPSTYTNVMQSRRNAEDTRRIREANEKATAKSQDQSALKELGTGMFTAYYAIQSAENALKEAIESGNPVAIRNAKTTLSQEKALYKKHKDQYDLLAAKVMKDLGVEAPAPGKEEKLDLDNDVDVMAAKAYQDLKGKIMTATDELRQRPEIMAEIERLKAEKNEKAVPTMDSVMAATGWKGIPFPLDAKAEKQEDEFVAPVGLGIFKRGMF